MVEKAAILEYHSSLLDLEVQNKKTLPESFLGYSVKRISSLSDLIGVCRKLLEEGKHIFIDYKGEEKSDSPKNLQGLKRGFESVEIFTTLSGLNSSCYNERVLSRYQDVGDGIIVNFIDLCLDYGMLYNIGQKFKQLPFIFLAMEKSFQGI